MDKPVERCRRTIGRIGRQALGLKIEPFLRPIEHRLRRAHLGLTDSAGGFHIHDDAELHVDEIIVGVGEECRSSHRPGPLRRRVGWRNKLRSDIAGTAKSCIIEGCEILLHGPARLLRIAILLPL